MRLLRDHVGSFKEDLQLQTSAMILLIHVSSASGFSEAVFDAMKIQVGLMSKNSGEEPVVPKMPLRHSFNKSQIKEGFFEWGQNELRGYILLGPQGAVELEEGEYFSINYEGFPADAITSIYAVDAPATSRIVQQTEEIVISGTTKDINVVDKLALYFPLTNGAGDGVESIQLQYKDRTVVYSEEEIKFFNNTINDLACVIDEQLDSADGTARLIKFGYDQLLFLDITNVLRIKVTPKTKNPVSIYTEKNIAI